jgi:hypothetical protein
MRIERLTPPVTNIQRPLFVLILFPDSNVESSNMASLGIGFGYSYVRHRENVKCSRGPKSQYRSDTTLTEVDALLQNVLQEWCKTHVFP